MSIELLAPAGSFSALRAAVQSGADSVYIGGSEFSARKSAQNFTLSEITEAVQYCHLRGVKVHVAANILVKERETAQFLEYMGRLNEIGVDAVIIADIGMASKIRRIYPDLPLHASTQMTVTSVSAAKKLAQMGFSRIVLARELTKEQIEKICKSVDVEIEVFAHGAICMCYSGQCLMSSMIGGRSGNRGMCAQPCRLPYSIGGKQGHFLSPKDMCMIEVLPQLSKIGVTSIKIEGRLKRSEYVAAVTGIYRKYIDNPKKVEKSDMDGLYSAFSRSGFTKGYFDGEIGRDMMCYENPSNVAENEFSADVLARCQENTNIKKSEIFMSAELKKDMPFCVSVWDNDGNFATVQGEVVPETAISRPLDKERITSQLLKLGDTPFYCESIEVVLGDGLSLPISEINAVRRNAVTAYCEEKLKMQKRRVFTYEDCEVNMEEPELILVCEVSTYEQAMAAIDAGVGEIYAPTALANRLYSENHDVKIIAKLPPVDRDDKAFLEPETDAILISAIGQLDETKECYGDFRLNITNRESVNFYKELKRVTISPELNLAEASEISRGQEIIAYGRLPLMVMENCPQKALGTCTSQKAYGKMRDRMGEEFLLRCTEGCYSEILNSKPIFMADKCEFVNKLKIRAIRLIFTVENPTECGKIIEEYRMAIMGKNAKGLRENTFTRGHFYRGVE